MSSVYKSLSFLGVNISALGNLDGALGDEIKAYKFKNAKDIPNIVQSFSNYYNNTKINCDVMLYIPSNKNGSFMEFASKKIANNIGIEVFSSIKFRKDIKEQKKLEYLKDRIDNVENAFCIENIEYIKNKNILLIDDVYATGATLKEVISMLLDYGVKNIECIVFTYREHEFL